MRIRSSGLTLVMGLSILVAACSSSGASTAPSTAATTPPTTAPSTEGSAAPSGSGAAPSGSAAHSDLKIGVVTDVGTVDDKNFNEYSYEGAAAGRRRHRRRPSPPVVVPNVRRRLRDRHPGVRRPAVQRHRHGRVQPRPATRSPPPRPTRTSGSSASTRRRSASPRPAIRTRQPADVRGRRATLLPNYIAINYEEDQAGYLAGIVAASVTKSGKIGAIGGINARAGRRPLHPGLRAGRQVGQPEHQGQDRVT